MSQTQTQTQTIATTDGFDRAADFQSLNSPSAKLVYLYLETTGEATADEICDRLDVGHMTAFSLLDTLVGEGMVAKRDDAYAVTPN